MTIIYGVGLLMALLAGGVMGWLLKTGHFGRVASQYREYEKEMAETRELYAIWAMVRHIKPSNSMGDDEPIA